ncbi:maleylpyruvate isomerase family mycothiol-dependent enzyme [Streptomyces pinistramenti]|uniref:maleylpyruvate isomerase family mycothiol-dependent enzyme n=1 Tax=Streptomyces pinistramenti TaxID=2884812 RepID=UPI001D068BC1|nr:maleylpyruvate isomerase family mycothiol-dependent enzyme [Streptomyces pinistramenti]MCB5906871.1 maleylpyruvate isomerase family mycothiol-dependent enzyme [Streptomyces pinistramenti]
MQGWELLEPVRESTKRFVGTVSGLTERDVRGPSLVPPWTRGHVITHVARAADSLCRLLEWARTGVETPQYASMDARAAEIEDGARRPVAVLVDDVVESAARFDAAVRALPGPAWLRHVRPRTGELCSPERLVAMRLRELEVHHADLAAGYTFADVPEPAARWIIDDIVAAQARRDGTQALRIEATDAGLVREWGTGGPVVSGPLAGLLAWLSGRAAGESSAVSGAEGIPEAPYWI